MEFIKKSCDECRQLRKFVKDTPREQADICGECWIWEAKPLYTRTVIVN